MKQIILAAVLLAASITGYAQSGNNVCVFNAITSANEQGGSEDLERGIKCSDEAATNESTMNVWKTWLYRGELYTLVFQDSVLNKKYGNAGFEALKAFSKCVELNDPKMKKDDWEDLFKYLVPLGASLFNEGVDLFGKSNFAQAFQYFYSMKEYDAIFKAKNRNCPIELATALKNAGIAAERSGNYDDAVKVYKDQIALLPGKIDEVNVQLNDVSSKTDAASEKLKSVYEKSKTDLSNALGMAYRGYVLAVKKKDTYHYFAEIKDSASLNDVRNLLAGSHANETSGGDNVYKFSFNDGGALTVTVNKDNRVVSKTQTGLVNTYDEAKKIVEEGLARLPNDANLLVEKINFFLETDDYVGALSCINNLLALDPKNDGALFIKGLAYDKLGNEDSVIYYYTKATEVNPKNGKAWYNLGAWYINKVNPLIEEMNKLGNSDKDIKTYDELKAKRKELYAKAKPYLLKAKELDQNDSQVNRILKQIDLYTGGN